MTPFRITVNFLGRRCPCCGEGEVYRTLLDMHKACPVCGVRFEREPGYFVGSMYVSYFFAALLLGFFATIAWLIMPPETDLGWLVLIAMVPFLPLSPFVQQYARILWMYIDRSIWPDDTEPGRTSGASHGPGT